MLAEIQIYYTINKKQMHEQMRELIRNKWMSTRELLLKILRKTGSCWRWTAESNDAWASECSLSNENEESAEKQIAEGEILLFVRVKLNLYSKKNGSPSRKIRFYKISLKTNHISKTFEISESEIR